MVIADFKMVHNSFQAQKRYDLAFTGMAKRAARAGDQFDVERKLERVRLVYQNFI